MKKMEQSRPKIIDTTLREGEQTPGVSFGLDTKKEIINGLAAVGIDEVEIGIASRENSDLEPLAKHIHAIHPRQSFSLWCRCKEMDILYGASLRPDCLSLSIPASDLHIIKKLGKDRQWVIEILRESIRLALSTGVGRVAVGLEDASRAEPDFVLELARIAAEAGAFRLRLADTVGIAMPDIIVNMLTGLDGIKIELGVHCHNDFGMATANTITALDHGAVWGDVTLLGLGERAGNCRLEEVVAFLNLQKKTGSYNLKNLSELSRVVARESGQQIEPSRPIIGTDLFSCETGIHLQGIMADPSTYEPFAPEIVGASRTLHIGRKAGRRSVMGTLDRLGLPPLDEPALTRLTRQVRILSARKDRSLTDHEIRELAMSS